MKSTWTCCLSLHIETPESSIETILRTARYQQKFLLGEICTPSQRVSYGNGRCCSSFNLHTNRHHPDLVRSPRLRLSLGYGIPKTPDLYALDDAPVHILSGRQRGERQRKPGPVLQCPACSHGRDDLHDLDEHAIPEYSGSGDGNRRDRNARGPSGRTDQRQWHHEGQLRR